MRPMAPSPTIPRVFPAISCPANCDLPFSTAPLTSSVRPFAQSRAAGTFLAARKRPQSTSSLTALALAPGVLKTTIPFSAQRSRGMLFTPAPALAMARRLSENSISCISWLLTSIPSASSILSVSMYSSLKRERPAGDILFNVDILYIFFPPISNEHNVSISLYERWVKCYNNIKLVFLWRH